MSVTYGSRHCYLYLRLALFLFVLEGGGANDFDCVKVTFLRFILEPFPEVIWGLIRIFTFRAGMHPPSLPSSYTQ